ncbi:MAG: cytochrome c3 family protein [Bryobacteraceae bacterium]|nr:cytochrome c3 family protein [Bryobacteraceae bacterium]
MSYYARLKGLDVTVGAEVRPSSLAQAMGTPLNQRAAAACFGCHSTKGVEGFKIFFDRVEAGIQCERCHTSAGAHAAAAAAGKLVASGVPRKAPAEEMTEFCGSCHRTWQQVKELGIRGVANVRFQPYRLVMSPCYSPEDERMGCTACHDPHTEAGTDTAMYDAKCNACHVKTRAKAIKTCRVGKANCAGCHMPKIEIPGAHAAFTDHMIRVVRRNRPYPE